MNRRVLGTATAVIMYCGAFSGEVMPGEPSPSQQCVQEYFSGDNEQAITEERRYLDAAQRLAASVDDKDVQSVAKFIGNRLSADSPSPDKVEVIGLGPSAEEECPYFKYLADYPAEAGYVRNSDFIFTKQKPGQPLSELWGVNVRIHEANHALRRHLSGDILSGPDEERDTRILEQRVISEVGGKPYRNALEAIKHDLTAQGFDLGTPHLVPDLGTINKYNAVLNEVFGPSINEEDRNQRNDMIYKQAMFELIEEAAPLHGLDVADAQQRFLDGTNPAKNYPPFSDES